MRKGAELLPEKHVFDSVRSNLLGEGKEEHMIQKIKEYIKKEPGVSRSDAGGSFPDMLNSFLYNSKCRE